MQPGEINEAKCRELKDLLAKYQLATAKLAEKKAVLERELAETLVAVGHSPSDVLCLDCGTVRAKTNAPCPTCEKG